MLTENPKIPNLKARKTKEERNPERIISLKKTQIGEIKYHIGDTRSRK